jgi:SAM-dependent methyltransferase
LSNATDRDWEELARRDPYFAVLTEEDFRSDRITEEGREAFFASGEHHVRLVCDVITGTVDDRYSVERILDFGCGVGRMLPAFAARCESLVGADVSPAMLEEARPNCDSRGVSNVELVCVDETLAGLRGSFDLIHSALVFQHIEPQRGEQILERLCGRLRPGGIAVLHFTTTRSVPRWESGLVRLRHRFRPLHVLLNLLGGRNAGDPVMQMNAYDVDRLCAVADRAGTQIWDVLPWGLDGSDGILLLLERPDPHTAGEVE